MNIYEIEQSLQEIFDTLEENGGEITPELEESLCITKDAFKQKVEAYTNVIKKLKSDINFIKEEEARLKTLKQSKEKLQDRLSKIVINSVKKFGDTSKSGSKFFDYGTGKVSIRKSESVITNDEYVKELERVVNSIFTNLKNNNQLHTIDFIGTDYVNTTAKQLFLNWGGDEEFYQDVVDADLDDVTATVSFKVRLSDLINKHYNVQTQLLDSVGNVDISCGVSKTEMKPLLKDGYDSNIAAIKINDNLVIK